MPKSKAKTVTIKDRSDGSTTVIKKGTKAYKKYTDGKQEYEAARKRIVKKAKKKGELATAERNKNNRRSKRQNEGLAASHTAESVKMGHLYGGKN